jgi:uncharacterized repeat protein (TIGR03837 family)
MKWFFYPGFTEATGGLLREAGLLERQAAFDRPSWLQSHGLSLQSGERLVVLFCYENAALETLLQMLGDKPTLLALTPGPAQAQVHQHKLPQSVRSIDLPWLSQTDFDHLLWSADLNLVRGEDSLVRALWAGSPFLWQLYPQADGAHQVKSAAFLDRLRGGQAEQACAQPPWARNLRRLWQLWNGEKAAQITGEQGEETMAWPEPEAWTRAVQTMRTTLLRQSDLSSQLMQFVAQQARRNAPQSAVSGAQQLESRVFP